MLDQINLVVSTVWREEDYITDTLASLSRERPISAEQPVCLCAGSPVTEHIERYRSQPGIAIIEMGANTWSWIKNNRAPHRATWNYYRCLTMPTAGKRGTLVLEDDVCFARGWQARLNTTLAALEERYGSDFVLAIYSPWFSVLEAYRCGQLCVDYPLDKFYGTQGVYYTAKTRQGFAKYLKAHGVVADEKPYDFLLRDYMQQSGLPLFASAPSLIQHIGRSSTIISSWHDAPGFIENLTTPM